MALRRAPASRPWATMSTCVPMSVRWLRSTTAGVAACSAAGARAAAPSRGSAMARRRRVRPWGASGSCMELSYKSAREADHVIDSGLHVLVGHLGIAAACRHRALGAVEAFDGVLVQRVLALGDAWAPIGLVAGLGCASHASGMAHGAGLVVGRLARFG